MKLRTKWQTPPADLDMRTATGTILIRLKPPHNVCVLIKTLFVPWELLRLLEYPFPSLSYEGQQDFDHFPPSAREGEESFVLKFHCPSLSSLRWIVKLYSLVLGGLGFILAFSWICFHLYVLSVTSLQELRQQRWVFSISPLALINYIIILIISSQYFSPFVWVNQNHLKILFISFLESLISVIFILDSIRISFEAQNWVIMKEEDKIILVLIEYLRFWCDGASLKFRNMQMNWSFKVFITLNYG